MSNIQSTIKTEGEHEPNGVFTVNFKCTQAGFEGEWEVIIPIEQFKLLPELFADLLRQKGIWPTINKIN